MAIKLPDGNWERHQSGETIACSGSLGSGRSWEWSSCPALTLLLASSPAPAPWESTWLIYNHSPHLSSDLLKQRPVKHTALHEMRLSRPKTWTLITVVMWVDWNQIGKEPKTQKGKGRQTQKDKSLEFQFLISSNWLGLYKVYIFLYLSSLKRVKVCTFMRGLRKMFGCLISESK